jgi:hypothetical protein
MYAQIVIFSQLFIIVALLVFQPWPMNIWGLIAGTALLAIVLFGSIAALTQLTMHANETNAHSMRSLSDAAHEVTIARGPVGSIAQYADSIFPTINNKYYGAMLKAIEDKARTFCCVFARAGDGEPPLITLSEENALAHALTEARYRHIYPNVDPEVLARWIENAFDNGCALRWLEDVRAALSDLGVVLVSAPGREAIRLGPAGTVDPPIVFDQLSEEEKESIIEKLFSQISDGLTTAEAALSPSAAASETSIKLMK